VQEVRRRKKVPASAGLRSGPIANRPQAASLHHIADMEDFIAGIEDFVGLIDGGGERTVT
jgi:hypothetical protein